MKTILKIFWICAILGMLITLAGCNKAPVEPQVPIPVLTDVHCEAHNTGFLEDTTMGVIVTVQNLGANGMVRVEGEWDGEGTKYDNRDWQSVYLIKGQIRTVRFEFDTSKFISGYCKGSATI